MSETVGIHGVMFGHLSYDWLVGVSLPQGAHCKQG
jgi:hypothetical protein